MQFSETRDIHHATFLTILLCEPELGIEHIQVAYKSCHDTIYVLLQTPGYGPKQWEASVWARGAHSMQAKHSTVLPYYTQGKIPYHSVVWGGRPWG